jgi:hypothetical protein
MALAGPQTGGPDPSGVIETTPQAPPLVSVIAQWFPFMPHHAHRTPAVPDKEGSILCAMPMSTCLSAQPHPRVAASYIPSSHNVLPNS